MKRHRHLFFKAFLVPGALGFAVTLLWFGVSEGCFQAKLLWRLLGQWLTGGA